jgi:hypothetical protein
MKLPDNFQIREHLITNIPLTSWGNEMKFTEKIEKELIYSNNQNL